MGIDAFVKRVVADRNLRLRDPILQAKLTVEKQKTIDALNALGQETLETGAATLFNTFVRPLNPKEGTSSSRMHDGAMDSAKKTTLLVGSVLGASGRAALWGVRKLIAK